MAYDTIVRMVRSSSLRERVAAAAAKEGELDPVAWASDNIWKIATQPQWEQDWQYAIDTLNRNMNPDIGARDDVINDDRILAAVQAVRGAGV